MFNLDLIETLQIIFLSHLFASKMNFLIIQDFI